MTRKDFEVIAATLASVKPAASQAAEMLQWERTVTAMARLCAAHNPRFARDRFFAACGAES